MKRIVMNRIFFLRTWGLIMFGAILFSIFWYNFLPVPLFKVPYSTVITDRNGNELGMTVASDGQFRIPGENVISEKYITALLNFEDKRFLLHNGVDPWAICRAIWLNLKNVSIVSGGSTLSMQVIRMSRSNPPRTFSEKFIEMVLAVRLEQSYTKWEILNHYATHAPFGSNIVGLQAAALKYFGRKSSELSWAEASLLAVLPNAPALIFPGRNMAVLKEKRDGLLRKLNAEGELSDEDLELAIAEPLPERVHQSECIVPHVLAKAHVLRKGKISKTTIDADLQRRVNDIVKRHIDILKHNHIYNAAVLVGHIPSGEVRAYVGNAPKIREDGGEQVDIITSNRSSGSILKPALYALMQNSGSILPQTILSDIPSRFGGYVPSNFSKEFQGVVPADQALSASLNIPFVRLLQRYGVEHFYDNLKQMGITTLNRKAEDYGLSLILGGAECSLWDVCNMYGGMASVLRHYNDCDGTYFTGEFERLHVWEEERPVQREGHPSVVDAASVWLTFQALQNVERPDMEIGWKNFVSSMALAWKTGTSFGFRDAWAVGITPDYVIGVWVGNANGEGRAGLIGVRTAAPVLFEVAALLRTSSRFYKPQEEMTPVMVCRKSGYRASDICTEVDTTWIDESGMRSGLCPYHRLIYLDQNEKYRVDSECEPVYKIKIRPWFVLSPAQEWYYTQTHTDYCRMPPKRNDCKTSEEMMEMIYPQKGLRVFIPRDLGGGSKGIVFEMAHREPSTSVYWHVDDTYIGMTRNQHQMEINVAPGRHVLYLIDAIGNSLRQSFFVVKGNENLRGDK